MARSKAAASQLHVTHGICPPFSPMILSFNDSVAIQNDRIILRQNHFGGIRRRAAPVVVPSLQSPRPRPVSQHLHPRAEVASASLTLAGKRRINHTLRLRWFDKAHHGSGRGGHRKNRRAQWRKEESTGMWSVNIFEAILPTSCFQTRGSKQSPAHQSSRGRFRPRSCAF